MNTRTTTKPQTGDLFPSAERAALVEVIHEQPMTTSRRIGQMFGKAHKNVLRAIEQLLPDLPGDFARLNFEPSEYTDPTGRRLPEYLLTQDGFLMLVMGFKGREAAHWRGRFIDAFNTMAKTVQRQQRALLSAERLRVRAEVARQHSSVNAVLVEVRRAAGKTTEAHHLANEARLIGYAVTGVFAGLDRDTLDADQLKLLHKVECRDVILIAQGTDYEARKTALRALVLQDQPGPDDPASAASPPQIGGDA
ncbi:MAG: Rha family transcriptional regulator [Leptothrix sp. (in: b-proteobacteria)]